MAKRKIIEGALAHIFQGINDLRCGFDNKRNFTIDGRLVGDVGEVIAELEYDITIDEVSQPDHDGTTPSGRRVQVKATFQDKLTFKGGYDLYLGLKLFEDGSFKEIYNGPGDIIHERYKDRKDIGKKLLSFPINEISKLQALVKESDKVSIRKKV